MSPPPAPEPHPDAAGTAGTVLLTPEDRARSRDRGRVHRARGGGRRWVLLWLLAGPGILTMLGENDGPSMVSYTATGAAYGVGFFLPFIVVTFAMAVVCQEMCMRVGAVTHRGYGQLDRNARRQEPGQRGLVLIREGHRLKLAALPGNGLRHPAVAVAVDQRGVAEQQVGALIAVHVHQHRPVRRRHRRGVRLVADRLPGDPVRHHLSGLCRQLPRAGTGLQEPCRIPHLR